MRKDKNKATQLRLKGYSYSQISQKLGVPKSTLSYWLRDIILSDTSRKKIELRSASRSRDALIKRNKQQTQVARQAADKIHIASSKTIARLSKKQLKMLGIALYWGEGYKKTIAINGREVSYHPVALANTDPKLIQIFLRFLREVCGVPESKLKASLRIYKHMNEKEVLNFWHRITNIPLKQFSKTLYVISKSSQGKRPYNRLPHGTLSIRVNDSKLFHKIMGWIDGVSSQA